MIPALAAETALSFLWRHWKVILGGAVVLGLMVALVLTRGALAGEKAAHSAERAAHRETIANYRLAQEVSTLKAERQRRDLEEKYRRNADEAENLHAEQLADASAATERYIAANRVRTQGAQCSASGTAAAASSDSASVPASAAATPELAAVTSADIRACTAAVIYGDNAHRWAMTLNSPAPPRRP